MAKNSTKMTMQECRDAILPAQQAGNWSRVIELKQRVAYIRKVQQAHAVKKKAVARM